MTLEQKRMAIEPENPDISINRQCQLLGLSRSSLYYKPHRDDEYNKYLMHLIDEQFTRTPFYGVPRMTEYLRRLGHQVNQKRIRPLMRKMGLEAIYPKSKRNLSLPDKSHKKYPYLLKGMEITQPDQVWSSDITYIRMYRGWVYLMVIMDWFSRYILDWELSLSLEAEFCITALERILRNGHPEIFNTDQGSQFTSEGFTDLLEKACVRISMDGRGRVFDNIFTERFWRSLKYEEVYLHDYQTVSEAKLGIDRYIDFYNNDRPHQSLGYRTPAEVYGAGRLLLPGDADSTAAVTPVTLRVPSVTAASIRL